MKVLQEAELEEFNQREAVETVSSSVAKEIRKKSKKDKDELNQTDLKVVQLTQPSVPPLYDNVGSEGGYFGTYETTKKGEVFFVRAGKDIRLRSIKMIIETDEIFYEVGFDYLGNLRLKEIPREWLNKSKIQQLASAGADVFDHNSTTVVKHLKNQEQNLPVTLVHQEIGWDTFQDKEIFKHYEAVGVESNYMGDLEINPKGSFEKWKEIIKSEVLGQIPLEAAVVFGLSAVVVGYIASELGVGNIIVHIFGDSTAGKTTACQVAISTSGYPELKKNGLMTNWNNTKNALMGFLRGNKGLPVLLDESSMSGINDYTNIIYMLEAGREKGRMNKDLTIRDAANWETSILSTGEYSLTSKANQNTGIKIRVFEFGNITWTKDARNADTIKEGLAENYGHAAPILAQHLLSKGKQAIIEIWRRWKKRCVEEALVRDEFTDRIALKQALLMTTAELARECLGLDLDVEGIFTFILENERDNHVVRDISVNAYDYFLEQVNIHQNNFGYKTEALDNIQADAKLEVWGRIETIEEIDVNKDPKAKSIYSKQIVITTSAFNKLMKDGGFEEPKIILRKWKQQGKLNCEADRLYRKRQVKSGGQPVKVYVIKVEEIEDERDIEIEQLKKKQKENFKKSKKSSMYGLFDNLDDEGELPEK